VGRAVARNYYGLAAEIERRWLAGQLENVDGARREAETARRELERTEGFSFFDARKVLNQCLERAAAKAQERGVELDTRDALERLTFRGNRQEVAALMARFIEEGIERTLIDPETKKGAPLRVFLKRSRTRLFFGVEAIGRAIGPGERGELFAAGNGKPETRRAADPALALPAARSLASELETVRRHQGRLRVESERLHKWERDRSVWVARTTFFVDLPLPARSEPEKGAPVEAREPRGRLRDERLRAAAPPPDPESAAPVETGVEPAAAGPGPPVAAPEATAN
jgi:hypothetical protein